MMSYVLILEMRTVYTFFKFRPKLFLRSQSYGTYFINILNFTYNTRDKLDTGKLLEQHYRDINKQHRARFKLRMKRMMFIILSMAGII